MGWLGNIVSGIGAVGTALGGPLGAGIGVVGNTIGGLINSHDSAKATHNENRFWADYNSPAEQMKRLSDAGLNPNLVYGQGANATYQPTGDVGATLQQGISQAMTRNQQLAQLALNKKSVESQIDKNQADANLSNQRAKTEQIQQQFMSQDSYMQQFEHKNHSLDASALANLTRADYNDAAAILVETQTAGQRTANFIAEHFGTKSAEYQSLIAQYESEMKRTEASRYDEILATEVALKQANISLSKQQIAKLVSDIHLNAVLEQTEHAKVGMYGAQAGLYNAEAGTQPYLRKMYTESGAKSHYDAVQTTLLNHWVKQGIWLPSFTTAVSGGVKVLGSGVNFKSSTTGRAPQSATPDDVLPLPRLR